MTLDADFWNSRYLTGQTGWDLGAPSPPLVQFIDQLPRKDLAILIPGCGNAHEAAYLLQQGFTNITVVDLAPALTAALEKQLAAYSGKTLRIITGNFFDLKGQYDLVLEQTFFCALDPALRKDYVRQMHALLKPGGRLAGVLFDRNFEGGPPFGGSAAEYRILFEKDFFLHTLAPCYNSIPPRAGSEVFIHFERRP